MDIKKISTTHLVKGEDLNHHGTLYAGRGVEWMVEAGFIVASIAVGDPNIVCMRINSLLFRKPVPKGQMVTLEGLVVLSGRTSLTVYVKVINANTQEFIVDGFFTYVCVDSKGTPIPHGIIIKPSDDSEQQLYDEACELMQEAKANSKKYG